MTREVYIGNGVTIEVYPNEKTKILDLNKAMEIFAENCDKEIAVGMKTDWYFTAQTVRNLVDIENFPLMSSSWDEPSISIDGKKQPCFIEIEGEHFGYCFRDGYLHGIKKITTWCPDLYKTIRQLDYEDLDPMRNELNAIIEKYQSKRKSDGMRDFTKPISKFGKKIQQIINEKILTTTEK